MALILIVIIMIIGLGIVGSLFASINPFIYKLGNVVNYNTAYYGAIMGLERGLLALRYHDAGFEGVSATNTGNISDSTIAHSFGKFSTDSSARLGWSITSRSVNSIPGSGDGNIEELFATGDSSRFNSLGYYEGLELPLYLDDTTDSSEYYSTPPATNFVPITPSVGSLNIKGTFRLPPKIKAGLNNEGLDDTEDVDSDTILDDVIVNRGIKGNDSIQDVNFSIIPTIRQNFALGIPIYEYDNALRESIINDGDGGNNINTEDVTPNDYGFHFGIPGGGSNSLLSENNILPLNSQLTGTNLETIINDNSITGLTLNFNIINRMRTAGGNIYPFLEWQLQACDLGGCTSNIALPDRFYKIEGLGQIGDYNVRLYIRKPVRETSNASNFTIIF